MNVSSNVVGEMLDATAVKFPVPFPFLSEGNAVSRMECNAILDLMMTCHEYASICGCVALLEPLGSSNLGDELT